MTNPGPPMTTGVSLDNWQFAPQLHWTFQHIADFLPTAVISRGTGPVAVLATQPAALGQIGVLTSDGAATTVAQIMDTTSTDGWLVWHDGVLVTEDYRDEMTPQTLHLLMSVSKSLVGSVVGLLAATGALDETRPLRDYVPALDGCGYAAATLRDLLDMRSGIAFSEDYLDPTAEVRVLEQAVGWATRTADVPGSMYEYLATLRQARPHGGAFEYRSCETDVLGWVCEAATRTRMPELMSQLLWSRIGAEFDANIGVDATGTGMFDGGISTAMRDLARFGTLIAREGTSLTGEQVLPPAWVKDSFAGGPDSRAAFAASPGDNRMPGGMYRNQFWLPFPDRDLILCLGIHGQMVYVNPGAKMVGVKLSSWPVPQDAAALFSTIAAFDAIAVQLQ